MELIEHYEKSRRGIFSGALGYISPAGDFDLNVVIRSIMYNADNHYVSYQAGSAITFFFGAPVIDPIGKHALIISVNVTRGGTLPLTVEIIWCTWGNE